MLHKSYQFEKEKSKFLKILSDGTTEVKNGIGRESGFTYRKFQVLKSKYQLIDGRFIDPEFMLEDEDLQDLVPQRKTVLKRLYDLYKSYPLNGRPNFFEIGKEEGIENRADEDTLPRCMLEMGLYNKKHYRGFFVTKDFSKQGVYEFVINRDGRWVNEVVDDCIPVDAKTMEPIWGLSVEQAWKIMLIKVYAKIRGGFDRILEQNRPFNFIDIFSNSTWRLYNLAHEAENLLEQHSEKMNICRIFLQTKNSSLVLSSGLIPNALYYQLVNIRHYKEGQGKISWVVDISSTVQSKWAGINSVIDSKAKTTLYENFDLQRKFSMGGEDFSNMFSFAYVTSSHYELPHYSKFITIQQEAGSDAESHFVFHVSHEGWFDFSFRQPHTNRVAPKTEPSKIKYAGLKDSQSGKVPKRYLKMRFVMSREVQYHAKQYASLKSRWEGYRLPQYQSYVIEYMQGYSKGDAKFLKIIPGKYLIWFKPEVSEKRATFNLHWNSQDNIPLEMIEATKKQGGIFLSQSLASIIPDLKTSTIYDDKIYEQLCYGDYFDSFGYGLIGVRIKDNSMYKLLIEFSPSQVQKSGYRFISPYDKMEEKFSIMIAQGQAVVIIMEQINEESKRVWPPKGVRLYREI